MDPQPAWFRAIELLESAVTQHPQFVRVEMTWHPYGSYWDSISDVSGTRSAHDTLSAGLRGYLQYVV